MKLARIVTAGGLLVFAAMCSANLNSMDRKFMMMAAQGGVFEVAANKMGEKMANHLEVKQHSMHMVMDHSKANAELMNLAKKKGVKLPKSTDAKHAKIVSKLKMMKGSAFDKYHVQTQLKAHEETIALFKKEVAGGQDKQLKEWARGKIPKLEEHLQMWQRAAAELGMKS